MIHSARLLLAVAAGGAAGAVLRWAAGEAAGDGYAALWTVLAINVVGSAALAALPLWSAARHHALVAAGVGPGLLGGFTTLSAASEQTRDALALGRSGLAAAYLLGTLAACLLAVTTVGLAAGRRGHHR